MALTVQPLNVSGASFQRRLRVVIELVLFGSAAAALAAAGQPVAAVVLGVAGVVTSLLNLVQERGAHPAVGVGPDRRQG